MARPDPPPHRKAAGPGAPPPTRKDVGPGTPHPARETAAPDATHAVAIHTRPGGIEFIVKVVPGASRTRVAGLWGTALKLAVAAPPEAGKANDAVVKLLAEILRVRRADISILSGHVRAVKRIAVHGLTEPAARQCLAARA